MTEREAIKELKSRISPYDTCIADKEANMAIDVSIKAIKKQIPKKWEYAEVNDCDIYVCPCCREYWYLNYGTPKDNKYNYCPNCGQKLEWK